MAVRNRLARFILAMATLAGFLAVSPAGARAVEEPLARFEDRICPGIVGMDVESAEAMVWRIRQNMEALGRRLDAPETCKPNLLVMFVASGKDSVEALRRSDNWLFDYMAPEERERLFNETGPARALVRTVPRTRDGIVIARQRDLSGVPQAGGFMAHSKIYGATRNDIVSAQVFLDRDAMKGLTIGQLADYVTFRALTVALPQTEGARAASIVSLFDEGATAPAGLTAFDKAYLTELYSGIPNIPGPTRKLALERATGIPIFQQ
jgi:hypothetical protein